MANISQFSLYVTLLLMLLWTPTTGRAGLISDAASGNLPALKALAAAHANVNVRASDGSTALIKAADNNRTDCVIFLIAVHANVNAAARDGTTALMEAAALDCQAETKADLAKNEKSYEKQGVSDAGEKLEAAYSNLPVVKSLIAARADVNAKEDMGDTALIMACGNGSVNAVRALIAAHADVNAKDNFGGTALQAAAHNGYKDCVKALKAAGATQ